MTILFTPKTSVFTKFIWTIFTIMALLVTFKTNTNWFFIDYMFTLLILFWTLFLLMVFFSAEVATNNFKLHFWTITLIVTMLITFVTSYSFRGETVFRCMTLLSTIITFYGFLARTFFCKMSFFLTIETRNFLILL